MSRGRGEFIKHGLAILAVSLVRRLCGSSSDVDEPDSDSDEPDDNSDDTGSNPGDGLGA